MKSFLTYILYVLALTPLVMDRSVFFPFISGKNLLIRVILTVAFALFAGYMAYEEAFRRECGARLAKLAKNPVFIGVSAFMLILIISTVFAHNTYRAFFGDIERAEGLVNMLYFYGFFLLSSLLFSRPQWLRFFQVTLAAGFVLFAQEMIDFANGMVRPSAQTGNPIYLAAFFLFVLLGCGYVLYAYRQQKEKTFGKVFWNVAAWLMVPASVLGIFVTETRGVIVGLAAGLAAFAIYALVRAKDVAVMGLLTLRKLGAYMLAALAAIGILFFATQSAPIWKRIPGFDRLSGFSATDPTIQTRLISLGVSMHALNPADNGIKNFLIGWGPENFGIAYNKYYNPEYFRYEQQWFDRAHNKLMDVSVMNGILGLAAYLGMWGACIWMLFRDREFSARRGFILFFGVSYFVQNLFVFDSITTYIPFFAFLALCALEGSGLMEAAPAAHGKRTEALKGYEQGALAAGGAFALFFAIAIFAWTIPPFSQMGTYMDQVRNPKGVSAQKLESAFIPYTYAQDVIRGHFLSTVREAYAGDPAQKNLLLIGVAQMEDVAQRDPSNPRYFIQIGQGYDALGQNEKDAGAAQMYYEKAEAAYRKALELAPKRQDIRYLLAYNLSFQNKNDEAIAVAREAVELDEQVADPHYYLGLVLLVSQEEKHFVEGLNELERAHALGSGKVSANDQPSVQAYYALAQYFYNRHDAQHALTAVERLKELAPSRAGQLDTVVAQIKNGTWRPVELKP
jgi:tetratricopeptide (TPR) repeat protein